MKLLIIIPAYNEVENIENVLETLKGLEIKGITVDYLVVNDCSKDNTLGLLKKANANFVDLPINLGIGGAVQTGYIYALENGYDIAIQMDGDGQHRADYIDRLVQPIIEGKADAVIGSRFIDKEGFQSSFMRRVGINFLSWLIRTVCGVQVKDVTSGFRAVNRKLIALFAREYAQDYPEPEAIVSSARRGARICEVPVIMNERIGGQSSIHGLKSLYYMIKVSLAVILCGISTPKEKL